MPLQMWGWKKQMLTAVDSKGEKAETECRYTGGETEEHLWMKKSLFQEFSNTNLYKYIELEYRVEGRIADIYLVNRLGRKVAVECQVSNLDITEFRKKTAFYSYKGIYTIWIFGGNIDLDRRLIKLVHTNGSRLSYQSSETERKCHRWYYGRIYYFYNDKIYAVHFHPIENWSPSSCDECLEQAQCQYPVPSDCPKYKPGYFHRPSAQREISIYPVDNLRLVCIDRKDKLRIAKFNEPAWWKI